LLNEVTAWIEAASLTAKRDQFLIVTGFTAGS
jgi:hypothetical protein